MNAQDRLMQALTLKVLTDLHNESTIEEIRAMSQQLDRLTTEVQEMRVASDSAITLLQGLSALIESLKDDPAALQQLSDDLDAQGTALAAAIVANTPAQAVANKKG